MNKFVVIGPPGAGKTEFADDLGQILSIDSTYHLDYFFWKPNWTRTLTEERLTILDELTLSDRWIIEGNFLDTIDYQFSKADNVIWLNLNAFVCLLRVIKRYLSYIKNGIPEIAPGCVDKITFHFLLSIFEYKFVDSKYIMKKIEEANSPSFIVLNTPKKVALYKKKLKKGQVK